RHRRQRLQRGDELQPGLQDRRPGDRAGHLPALSPALSDLPPGLASARLGGPQPHSAPDPTPPPFSKAGPLGVVAQGFVDGLDRLDRREETDRRGRRGLGCSTPLSPRGRSAVSAPTVPPPWPASSPIPCSA